MMYVRFILSSLALAGGLLILVISLSKNPATVFSSDGTHAASTRQLYWDAQVLPDHIAYPVLMTIDRVRLEAASPQESIYLRVEYAHRRLEYAKALLEKGESGLALTTMTKAQKYLLHAAHDLQQHDLSPAVHTYVVKSLEFQMKEVRQLKADFDSDQDRAVLDRLLTESAAVLQQIAPGM